MTTMKPTELQNQVDLTQIASALGVTEVSVFLTGVEDGLKQGPEPAVVMMYDEPALQWEYDTGCHVGACLALRHPAERRSFYLPPGGLIH
jgi:hydroxyethylthiazole kinase-like sugar kinase family protein